MAGTRDRVVEITVPSGRTVRRISAIEPEALGTVLTPRLTAGTADLRRGVVVSQNQADMLGLRLGDPITLASGDVPVHTSVAGVYDATELAASIYYDVALAPPTIRGAISMVYTTGPDPTGVRAAVEAVFAQRPDVRITDREGLAAEGVAQQQAAFVLMYAMFGLAILIAVFGVVNTLALSVRELTREIGVLRAVGAPRALVRRTVRAESVVIALFGAVLGVVMGVFVGAVMQHAMLGQQLWDAVVPFETSALCLAGVQPR